MPYDFSQLNDKEFEAIVADLLSLEFRTRVERFKPGKDKGVDGRFFAKDGGEHIIQCKHYIKSGYSKLLQVLKNSEMKKVRILDPKAYYFATSVPLSMEQKKVIQQVFTPYIRQQDHVFGPDDLNQLLDKYGEIEKRYYKLWLASSNVLTILLNHAITGRSEFELNRIRSRSKLFVETKDFHLALRRLNDKRVVVLSGEPGIGKTTLADNLCLNYACQGYQFVYIEENISEAESIYAHDKKQVFYYDDFLGSNYLEAIEGKRDSHILNFIERVKLDPRKKFILTSRTNIFRQGILCSPILSNRNIHILELMLDIKKHTEYDKAKILYNHLWFGSLSENYISEIYESKRYIKVVKHKNYNPRLIEFITDPDRIVNVTPSKYWQYILHTMDNPKDVWGNCFKFQSNPQVRALVILVVVNGGEICEVDLRSTFTRFLSIEGVSNFSHTEMNYNSACTIVIKSFLNRFLKNNEYFLKLFNPSISDYILSEYKESPAKLKNALLALGTLESLNQLESMRQGNILNLGEDDFVNMFQDSVEKSKSVDYQLRLAEFLPNPDSLKDERIALLARLLSNSEKVTNLSSFFRLLNLYWGVEELNQFSKINEILLVKYLNEDALMCLLDLIADHKIDIALFTDELEDTIRYYIQEEVVNLAEKEDVSVFYSSEMGYHGEFCSSFNSDSASSTIDSLAEEVLKSLDLARIPMLEIDLDKALEDIDVEEIFSPPEFYYDDEREPPSPLSYESDIDDLFERT